MSTPHHRSASGEGSRPPGTIPPESFAVVPARSADGIDRDRSERFLFCIPPRWRSKVRRSPYAAEAERRVLGWFESLGCTQAEVDRARRFDVAGYVGIPFPSLSLECTVHLAKYLSLWLLWDDVEVETLGNCWRIGAEHVLSGRRPEGMTRFDVGWWQLLRDMAERRSPRWIADLCAAMSTWSAAAVEEAEAMEAFRERRAYLAFDQQLDLRIKTIGMFATVLLLEDAYDHELPPEIHGSLAVRRIKVLSNEIVGLGNDLLSFGKDHAADHLNLATTLMHEQHVSVDVALERLLRMHDEALAEYDALADGLASGRSLSAEDAPIVARWLQDVRHASVGFTLWESQAPRYTAHKVVHRGRVIEPRFPSQPPPSSHRPTPPTLRTGARSTRGAAPPNPATMRPQASPGLPPPPPRPEAPTMTSPTEMNLP